MESEVYPGPQIIRDKSSLKTPKPPKSGDDPLTFRSISKNRKNKVLSRTLAGRTQPIIGITTETCKVGWKGHNSVKSSKLVGC